VIVHDGRLIQTGETAEVMRNPATKHVALLVGDSNDG
jgi:ABC-type proline/glycine betaine transport system ATPase subunit